ncbi:ribosomal RNA processing protein 36 homolog [Pholidichthys leucotaenia]
MKTKRMKQQRVKLAASEQKDFAGSSNDEDLDAEKNFALLRERERMTQEEVAEEGESNGDEEEDGGTDDEEDSDHGEEEGDEEENDISEDSDDGDEDLGDGGGSSEFQTKEDIRKELSSMSFEDIMKLQNKVGTKAYNEVAYGKSSKSDEDGRKKRLNKNRPMEISAKRPVPFLRQVVPVRKPTLRDPRFDDLSGEYKPEIFEKTYKFINDIKAKEKEVIQKQLRRMKKNNQRKDKLQFLLKRMDNQERARRSREQQRERELQLKRQQRERAAQGAQPFFMKKSEMKKLQLAEKYQELKKSGKLENFLSKKRRRNATKDRRKLPNQPQSKKAT